MLGVCMWVVLFFVFVVFWFFFLAAFSWQKYNIDNSVRTFSETTVTGYWLCWGPNLEDMSVQMKSLLVSGFTEVSTATHHRPHIDLSVQCVTVCRVWKVPCSTFLLWCRQPLWASTRLRLFLEIVKQGWGSVLPPASATARATFMHSLCSYGSLVVEWPFLPWGLGGESSCWKSGSPCMELNSQLGVALEILLF